MKNGSPVRFHCGMRKNFLPDTAAVSLRSSWYWSGWLASRSLCGSVPCSCKKTRMFSARNSWLQYSTGKSTGTTGYISSSYSRHGLKVLFPAMRRKSAVLPETQCWKETLCCILFPGRSNIGKYLPGPEKPCKHPAYTDIVSIDFSSESVKSFSKESCRPCFAGRPRRPVRSGARS